jgi:uncharacterized protein
MLGEMTDLTQPLTELELDRLDQLLLDRIGENVVTEDSDEGVLNVSELDGFFTAIVSGPVTVAPSQWLPATWGDFEPTWDDSDDFEAVLSLFLRHMNGIAVQLIEDPDDFEPIYLERTVDDGPVIVIDDWCEGYMRGAALCADAWDAAPADVVELLTPIVAFTGGTDWAAHDMADGDADLLRDEIAPSVRAIHAFWLERRGGAAPSAAPFRRDRPRVGRNDPCPCGSGKKYKHCCLQ